MSLPDTVFIFVLALIIFGPKKLPEIGRQLGRLVGEFRRASNEFKFQIEEELRQVEISDRQKTAASRSELESSTSNENPDPSSFDMASSSDGSTSSDLPYAEETLPVGQYPNIDTLNSDEWNDSNPNAAASESYVGSENEVLADTQPDTPTVRAAAGAQPRTTLPYSDTESGTPIPGEAPSAASNNDKESPTEGLNTGAPSGEDTAPTRAPEHTDPYAASTAADIHHG